MKVCLIAALFIAFLFYTAPVKAAALCDKPATLSALLNKNGYFESAIMRAQEGFSLSLFMGQNSWVLLIWNDQNACVAAHGKMIWATKKVGI